MKNFLKTRSSFAISKARFYRRFFENGQRFTGLEWSFIDKTRNFNSCSKRELSFIILAAKGGRLREWSSSRADFANSDASILCIVP